MQILTCSAGAFVGGGGAPHSVLCRPRKLCPRVSQRACHTVRRSRPSGVVGDGVADEDEVSLDDNLSDAQPSATTGKERALASISGKSRLRQQAATSGEREAEGIPKAVAEAVRLRRAGRFDDAHRLLVSAGALESKSTNALNELLRASVRVGGGLEGVETTLERSPARKDASTYGIVVAAARRALATTPAFELCARIVQRAMADGVALSAVTLSNYFNVCAKVAAGDAAWAAWKHACENAATATEIDVVTCSSLLHCLAKGTQVHRVEEVVAHMEASGVKPNQRTYASIMDAFAKAGRPRRALDVYSEMRRNGMELDFVSYCTVLHCYALLGDVDGAATCVRMLVRDGHVPNKVVYNCLLEACAKAGDIEAALALIGEMRSRGFLPLEGSIISLLQACGRVNRASLCDELLDACGGVALTPPVYNTLVGVYVRAGGFGAALGALDRMERAQVAATNVTYNIILAELARQGQLSQAFQVLELAERRGGVSADVVAYNALISAAASKADTAAAVRAIECMQRHRLRPDAVTWGALLRCLIAAGEKQQARALLLRTPQLTSTHYFNEVLAFCTRQSAVDVIKAMITRKVTIDAGTVTSLVNVLASSSDIARSRMAEAAAGLAKAAADTTERSLLPDFEASTYGEELVRRILSVLQPGDETDSKSSDAADKVHAGFPRASRAQLRFEILRQMLGRGETDEKQCNREIVELCKLQRLDEMMTLVQDMRVADLSVDARSYTAMVAALCEAGRVDAAFGVVGEMESRREWPSDLAPYVAVVHSCGQRNDFDRARSVFDRVRALEIKPTVTLYNALLYTAGIARRPDLAFQIFENLKEEKLEPDAVTVSALGSVCLRNRICDDRARTVLQLLEASPDRVINRKLRLKARRLRALLKNAGVKLSEDAEGAN